MGFPIFALLALNYSLVSDCDWDLVPCEGHTSCSDMGRAGRQKGLERKTCFLGKVA